MCVAVPFVINSSKMENWEIVDDYFCQVCSLPEQGLSESTRALVEVYRSFGLIQNGGLHGYLCSIGDEVLAIAKFYEIVRIDSCANILRLVHDLWCQYWSGPIPDGSDPDDFRDRFGSELDRLEEGFLNREDELMDALAVIVREQSTKAKEVPAPHG